MEEVWLIIALALLVIVVWWKAKDTVLGGLDARAERIRNELQEAERLREEAQAMLAQYQKQLHEGEARAQAITRQAEQDLERQTERRNEELEAALKRRTDQAMQRIAQAEASTVRELRGRAAELAMGATRRLVTQQMQGEQAKAQLERSIGDVRQRLA
ncbi:F0F1 ATP synthase subunit B family protein [Marinivivus vitaminiproducens]|uniref:F0F1 ATP synthase subunit B family protein n=1 Tax=Marinivivus vitaminiproducens TaxID=3035935 RepID=UPI00279BC6CA|nr:F0F1 ATP synthase subunit B [Geminicoccaceae bacterium SCSIO 64248]